MRRLKDVTKKTSLFRCIWDVLKTSQKRHLFWDVSERSLRYLYQWRSDWDLSETSHAGWVPMKYWNNMLSKVPLCVITLCPIMNLLLILHSYPLSIKLKRGIFQTYQISFDKEILGTWDIKGSRAHIKNFIGKMLRLNTRKNSYTRKILIDYYISLLLITQ